MHKEPKARESRPMHTLGDALKRQTENPTLDIFNKGFKSPEVIMNVRENSKKPGTPIFVRDDGKVGFPTLNSISVKIGDRVQCRVQYEADTYFLLEVKKVID